MKDGAPLATVEASEFVQAQNDLKVAAAELSLGVTREQLKLGSVSYLALIVSEQTYQQTVISLIQARTARFADTAALFQALGGAVAP